MRRKLEVNTIHVRQDRELHGTLDSYQNLQPTSMPEIKKERDWMYCVIIMIAKKKQTYLHGAREK